MPPKTPTEETKPCPKCGGDQQSSKLADGTPITRCCKCDARWQIVSEPDNPPDRTPEQLAKEYAATFHVNQSDRIKAFLAGHSAGMESAKETIDRLTRERDEVQEITAWDISPAMYEAKRMEHIRAITLLTIDAKAATASFTAIKSERDAIQSDLSKAREERDEARITRNNIGAKWQQIATVAELERDEAREEIARLKGVLAEWSGKAHGPNGPWDMLHKATAEATTLRAELTAAREESEILKVKLAGHEGFTKGAKQGIESLKLEFSAANARAEEMRGKMEQSVEWYNKERDRADKAEKERDAALVLATRRKQERNAANARAVNPELSLAAYLLNVRAIMDQRDSLRRKLAEVEASCTVATNLNLRIDQERDELRKERDSALAALEATRDALGRALSIESSLGSSEAFFPNLARSLKEWAHNIARPSLSLSPSTALRDLKLKVAEAAYKDALRPQFHLPESETEAALEQVWLASDTRAGILGEAKP